jgi:hypothetical protein
LHPHLQGFFDTFSISGLRFVFYPGGIGGINEACLASVNEFYTKLFETYSSGTSIGSSEARVYPSLLLDCNPFDDDEENTFWGCTLDVAGDSRSVTEPQCDIDSFGFSLFSGFSCVDSPCDFVSVTSPLQNIETSYDDAVQLVFGAKASVGLVCAYAEESQDAVDNNKDLRVLPGFCCLDSPYSSQEFWGTKASTIVSLLINSTMPDSPFSRIILPSLS